MPGRNEVWSIVPRILIGRVCRTVAMTAALTVLAGGLAYASANKRVLLVVDGETRRISAPVTTVQGLLMQERIAVSQRDSVVPPARARLAAGTVVTVRHARPLYVTLDGERRAYWTRELTVGTALDVLGIRGRDMVLSLPRPTPIGRQGISVDVATTKRVRLVVDGAVRTLVSTAPDVRTLLSQHGVTVRARDLLSVSRSTPLREGLVVRVRRVTIKTISAYQRIHHATSTRRSGTLLRGRRTVATKGRDGLRRVTYRLVLVGGDVKEREVVSRRTVRRPVTRVVTVGTRRPGTPSVGGGIPSGGGLNWAALARCESGGNPRIVSSNGLYHGLFQFSVGTWRSVGGRGLPSRASASEQLLRAQILYRRTGASSWPHCGRRLFG